MKKISTFLRFIFSQDYRDYRFVRTLHVFESNYHAQLLHRYRPQSYKRIQDFEDPLWLYFLTARDELAGEDFPLNSWHQCCDPHPFFDTYYYVSRNKKRIGKRNPFAHYLSRGWKQGLHPSPLFDATHYASLSGWSEEQGDPLTHYARHGLPAGMCPVLPFDREWYYADQLPYHDIEHTSVIKHYKLHGAREGKSLIPVFNVKRYLDYIGNISDAVADPLLHYLCVGEKTGARSNEHFDSDYYKNRYLETSPWESPLLHYFLRGVHEKAEINEQISGLAQKPVISVVVPVFNPEIRYLRNCIRSVLYQSYPYWELCLVDDCSEDDAVRDVMRRWAAVDGRITCTFNEQNSGISVTTQNGIEAASGEFVGFLDNDDELTPDCLFHVARAINETNGKIFYTDEDLVGDFGARLSIFYKPDFNKALLYSHNYITHFVVASKSLILEAGGLASEFDGAQDYDLVLKLSDTGEKLHHIPHVLYHWRAIDTSTSIAHEQKPYAHEAGRRALENCLKRNNIAGLVTGGPVNFHYRIELSETVQPSVTVIIAGNDHRDGVVERERIEKKTNYENASFHWIGMSDSSRSNGPGSNNTGQGSTPQAQVIQEIIEGSKDEYIAILGYGTANVSENWVNELLSKMSLDHNTGIVCGRVSYGGTDGSSFTMADVKNSDALYYAAFIDAASKHSQGLHNLQWVNGCDWHICLISRKLIDQVGGFDYHRFPDLMAMLDFSYRSGAAGKKALYTPDAVVALPEMTGVRIRACADIEKEKACFQKDHYEQLLMFERYYNVGHLIENGCDRDTFYRWLAGTGENRT